MTYDELNLAVKLYLARDNMSDDDFFALVSIAHGKIQRVLKNHPRNTARAMYTQPANNAFLPLPVTAAQIIGVYIDGIQLRQFPAELREPAAVFGGYIDKGTCLELFPIPTEDTEFRLDYYNMLPPLDKTDPLSTNWVLSYYPDVYVYSVLSEAAIFYRDDTRYEVWTAEFVQRIVELHDMGWGQNLSASPIVRAA